MLNQQDKLISKEKKQKTIKHKNNIVCPLMIPMISFILGIMIQPFFLKTHTTYLFALIVSLLLIGSFSTKRLSKETFIQFLAKYKVTYYLLMLLIMLVGLQYTNIRNQISLNHIQKLLDSNKEIQQYIKGYIKGWLFCSEKIKKGRKKLNVK